MCRFWIRPLGGLLLCLASSAGAQTPAQGRISGRVTDPSGLAVPNVVVTARSPSAGPARSVRTAPDGRYLIDALKAGDYTVTFDIVGFVPRAGSARVPDGGTAELDARGYPTIPSDANFFMVHLRRPVQPVVEEFRKKGVIVGRPFPPMTEHLRVSIGNPDEMGRFMAAFKELFPSANGG